MSGFDMTLRVDPNILSARADDMNAEKIMIMQIMELAKAEIISLNSSWKSAAADELQNRFKQVCIDIDNMLAITADHIDGIKEIALIYTQADSAVKAAAEGLPTDGVIR